MKELDKFQKDIERVLVEVLDISPFSITCTFALDPDGMAAITFWIDTDVSEFLDWLEYSNQCDKTGYLILRPECTVILTGMALVNLYSRI